MRANNMIDAVWSSRQEAFDAGEEPEVIAELDGICKDLSIGMELHESMRARGYNETLCTIIGYGAQTGEGLPHALRLAAACSDAIASGAFEPATFRS